MIQLKDVYKVYNDTILKKINIEITSSIVLFGPYNNKEVLFKLLCGQINPDEGITHLNKREIFYISNNLYNKFNKVSDLINYYKAFYSIKTFEYKNVKLKTLDYSNLALLYATIAANSDAKYIFIDYLFKKIDISVKMELRDILRGCNKILVSIENINACFDDYIYVTQIPFKSSLTEISKLYYKGVLEFDYDINLRQYKEVIDHFRQVNQYIVVLRKEDVSTFLDKVKPTSHKETHFNYHDIEAIGNLL